MIIFKYLVRENLKTQITVLFVLLLIFISQKLINILNTAFNGDIPLNIVFPLLLFGIPEMIQLMLPLSLFLGLLIRFSKFYTESEIIVMQACGFNKSIIVKVALTLAVIISLFSIINTTLLLPWSFRYQDNILMNVKINQLLFSISDNQFKTIEDGNFVLYFTSIKDNKFKNVFFAKLNNDNSRNSFVIIADDGYIEKYCNDKYVIILNNGKRYEGIDFSNNFRITNFVNYKSIFKYKKNIVNNRIEQKNMIQLWNEDTVKSNTEFHWRLTLVFSIFIMALIVIPLSEVNLRQGRIISMLPALFLYLIYFLFHGILRNSSNKYDIDLKNITWLINFFYLVLSIILNIWNTTYIYNIRLKLIRGLINVFNFR